ncbi:TetR/AcrR family transcriptional regulator [Phytomonospora endophytica]|uniref:AcrR family transcriptional regulator n=1 Tax=Phytomonospora endophytica TaxID=714109 RepID=A0A841G078_9ACTN|nr:TetR/AcrR family transcriptional regulator [Phytomonospora endophytica]MBB6037570.1 AcrR family transcriptional regulator [Phytomonospora endophytica]
MSRLIEQASPKAGRILDSARELALRHGVHKVTIAEIAAAAGVGKGTVYLYWETKEDLFVGLIAREVLAWLDDVGGRFDADRSLVLPRRFAPMLLRTTAGNPWLRWLRSDDSALARLMHRPEDRERFAEASPGAMGSAVLGILRERGVVRDDLPLPRQMYALHALLVGFGLMMDQPDLAGGMNIADPDVALAEAVHLLLEPERDPSAKVVAEAAEAVRVRFGEIHDRLLAVVAAGAAGTR